MCFEWNEGGYIFIFGWNNPFAGVNSARVRCMCHHAIGSQSISTAACVCMRAHGSKSVLFPSNISHVAGTVPRADQTPVICHGAVWCLVWSWQASRPRAVLSICLSLHTRLYMISVSPHPISPNTTGLRVQQHALTPLHMAIWTRVRRVDNQRDHEGDTPWIRDLWKDKTEMSPRTFASF